MIDDAVRFPADFLWGASTAAFQIEGSTATDGRSDSIWDAFARVPGAVANGDTGEPAADHYRRMSDDVALMADLGLPAYRFSIAWPRVRPDGAAPNPSGLDFYHRLVDELLLHDIQPWVTLYHWDLPQKLEDVGGWTNRDTAARYAEYVETVVTALGDRVTYWNTLNEPWCSAFLGYAAGIHAPGRRDPKAAVAAVHHLLLAHGRGVQAVRAQRPDALVGLTTNPTNFAPADPASDADVDLVRHLDGLRNRLFLDPVLHGRYPADVLEDLEEFGLADHIQDGDLDLIAAPSDLIGVNYYEDYVVKSGPSAQEGASPWLGAEHVEFVDNGLARTAMDWQVRPNGLYDLLTRLHRDYAGKPIYLTENGAAFDDVVDADGKVHDTDRVAFYEGYLRAAHRAMAEGVDLRGFIAWSWMDNFEWALGYGKRFGLVHVDYDTQERTVKDSGAWYSSVVTTGRLP